MREEKRFKVLYMLEIFPEISETFILDEALEAKRQGVDVRIVSLARPKAGKMHQEAEELLPYTLYPYNISLYKKYLAAFIIFAINPIKCIKFVKYLYSVERYIRDTRNRFLEISYLSLRAKTERVDHIHAHFGNLSTSYAMWVHMLTNIPYTFTTHGYDVFYVLAKDLKQKTILAKKHLTPSDFNKRYLCKKLGLDDNDIKRVYIGIDSKSFSSTEAKGKENLILNVGRLEKVKGQEYLIRACKILKDKGLEFKCRIIGSGKEEAVLAKLIKELSLDNVCFLEGEKTKKEIFDYYHKARVFVLSSISEVVPSVLKESLACGLPAVATRVGSIPEIILDGRTGLLAEPQSAEDIAGKVIQLWNNEIDRIGFSKDGRRLVEDRFRLNKQVKELINIWQG